MRRFSNQPIQRKLLLLSLGICGVVLLVAGLALFLYQSLAFQSSFRRDLATTAQIIANNSTAALEFKDASAAREILEALRAKPSIVSAGFAAPDGSSIARFGGETEHEDLARFPRAGQFLNHRGQVLYTQPVFLDQKLLGVLYLRADYRTEFLRLLGFFSLVLLGILAGSAALAVPLSRRLQRSITRPILQLAATARRVGEQQDYSARAQGEDQADELGDLARAFNQMLERLQVQGAALRESETRYRLLLENQGEGAGLVNTEETFTLANPAADEVFGCPRGGLVGRSLREFISVADYVRMELETEKRKQGVRSRYELEIQRPDGTRRWIAVSAAPVQSTEGHFAGTFGVFRDITEQKRAEEELRQRYAVERLISEISGKFINLPPDNINAGIDQALRTLGEFAGADRAYLLAFDDNHRASNTNEWCAPDIPAHIHRLQNLDLSAFPWWMDKLRRQETIHVAKVADLPPEADAERVYMQARATQSCVAVPMVSSGNLAGFFGFDAVRQPRAWTETDFGMLTLAAQIFESALERQRAWRELQQLHQRLLLFSRQAGMAEVATGVLHNVGNVLNSVNVSATLVADRMRQSKLSSLARVAALVGAQKANLPEYLSTDPKGRLLPDYLNDLSVHLQEEQQSTIAELEHLTRNVEHIKEIVAMQQSYARVAGVVEPISVPELLEDAVRIQLPAYVTRGIQIVRRFDPAPPVLVDRHKVLQILVNLLSNACHALDASAANPKQVTLEIRARGVERVCIAVTDNGAGIAPETLTRIFGHGFTTRKDGHGFGLHSGALAAREMGGALTAHSQGLGCGATFVLELPVATVADLPAAPGPAPVSHLTPLSLYEHRV